MNRITRIGLGAVLALGLAACGGGGGSNGGPANTSSQPLMPPATVGILITDAHGTRWDQAFATITSIEFLGDDDYRQVIFEGEETVDLLSLADYSELFAVADGVFPGEVEKIRLQLLSLELVDLDDMGSEIERVFARLVGNGKIDINLQDSIAIAGGETIIIELDFDMEKAFKATETGNGQVIVRPIIFAHVRTDGIPSRLTRVFGFVHSIEETEPNFVLCQMGLYVNHEDADEEHGDDDYDRCILVRTDDMTGIFDLDGNTVSFANIMREDELTAVGFLRYEDEDDDDDDESDDDADGGDIDVEDDFVLEAVVIELGTNFDRFVGTVQSEVVGDAFDFLLASGQGFESDTVVATQMTIPGTRIFSTEGEELDTTAITPETPAVVDGVLALGGDDTDDVLRAALIVLDLELDAEAEILRGEIISVEPGEGTLQLMVEGAPRCVNASAADIFLISTADGFVSEPGELDQLESGDRTDVYGEEGVDGCFMATDILSDID